MPVPFKESRTGSIPKGPYLMKAGDYHPITVGSLVYWLFTKVLLKQLTSDTKFDDLQGGFCDDHSASTNLFLLQGILAAANARRKGLYAIALDTSKAFDPVTHKALFAAFTGRVSRSTTQSCSVTCMLTDDDTTFTLDGATNGQMVLARQGIKQGEPLSPLLFNCVIDPLLQNLHEDETSFHLDSQSAGAIKEMLKIIL